MNASLALQLAPAMALLATVSAVPSLRGFLLSRRIVDEPGPRRSHQQVTPRGGGLAMVVGLMVASVLIGWQTTLLWPLLIVIAMAALPGWLDDLYSLPVWIRLCSQLVLALGLVLWIGLPATVAIGPVQVPSGLPLSVLAVLAIIWVINFHNFMDGSDGLAAQQAVWQGGAVAALFFLAGDLTMAFLALSLLAVALGFLVYNYPKASIFMGDSGSLMIGTVVAGLMLVGLQSQAFNLVACLIIASVFLVDATATLLWRLGKRRPWYTAHRDHAYQRLIRTGWTHSRVLWLYSMINLVLVLPALVLASVWPGADFLVLAALITLLLFGWALVPRLDKEEP